MLLLGSWRKMHGASGITAGMTDPLVLAKVLAKAPVTSGTRWVVPAWCVRVPNLCSQPLPGLVKGWQLGLAACEHRRG